MSDNWDFYFCNVNGKPASIFLDLGIRKSAPIAAKPTLLWVWVHLNQPRPDGFSDSAESDALSQIEDALSEGLASSLEATSVGRITGDGRREFYFYGPDGDSLQDVVKRALDGFPEYRWEAGAQNDPQWEHYLTVLYPADEERQMIENRRVLDALTNQGDTLDVPRQVDHWIHFPSQRRRKQFVKAVKALGYRVESESGPEDAGDKGHPFGIHIARTDHVDYQSINSVTLELFRLAREHEGDYDGWETAVMTGDQ